MSQVPIPPINHLQTSLLSNFLGTIDLHSPEHWFRTSFSHINRKLIGEKISKYCYIEEKNIIFWKLGCLAIFMKIKLFGTLISKKYIYFYSHRYIEVQIKISIKNKSLKDIWRSYICIFQSCTTLKEFEKFLRLKEKIKLPMKKGLFCIFQYTNRIFM